MYFISFPFPEVWLWRILSHGNGCGTVSSPLPHQSTLLADDRLLRSLSFLPYLLIPFLMVLCFNRYCLTIANYISLCLILSYTVRRRKCKMNAQEREVVEKAMSNKMIDVHVRLYEPFHKFLKAYLAFFGSKYTVEEICRLMIHNRINDLYLKLEEFAGKRDSHLEKGVLFNKFPHLACVCELPGDEEE